MLSEQDNMLKNGSRASISQSATTDIDMLVQKLGMQPHPDGGFFCETWRGRKKVVNQSDGKVHDVGSSIYYLFRNGDTSKWHRSKFDELFFWHAGGVIRVHTINSNGELATVYLGDTLKHPDCQYQVVIDSDTWMALEPTSDSSYVLIGVIVTPGFEPEARENGERSQMKRQFPQHADIIDSLCADN